MRTLTFLVLALLAAAAFAQGEFPFDQSSRGISIRNGEVATYPLFSWSNNEGRSFTSTLTGDTFSLPDEAVVINRADASFETYSSNFKNTSELKTAHSKSSGWSINLFFVGIHSESRMAHASELMTSNQAELYVVQKAIGVYDVAAWKPQLSSVFVKKVGALPQAFDMNAYKTFYDQFGSHYFTQARYGGEILFYVVVKDEVYKTMTKSEVARQVGGYVTYYCAKLGVSGGYEKSDVNLTSTFMANAKMACEIRPGDGYFPDCASLAGKYADYIATVLRAPALLTPQITPIADLVARMPGIPAVIVQNLNKALPFYRSAPSTRLAAPLVNKVEDLKLFSADKDRAHLESMRRAALLSGTVPGSQYIGMTFDLVNDEYRVLPALKLDGDTTIKGQCSTQACGAGSSNCLLDPLSNRFGIPKGICATSAGARSMAQLQSYAFSNRSDFEHYYEKTTTKRSWLIKKTTTTVHEFTKRFFQEDLSMAISRIQSERYTLTLDALIPVPNSMVPLHPRFIDAVAALPSNYDAQAYRAFIGQFGTHYVTEATLGSRLVSQDWFHRCLMYTYSDNWTQKNSGFSLIIVSHKSAEFNQNAKIDAKWAEYSSSLIQYQGGDPFHFSATQYDQWLSTVPASPAAVKTTLAPLSDLIQSLDATKANNLNQAVTDYVNAAYQSETTLEAEFRANDPKDMPSWCSGYPK